MIIRQVRDYLNSKIVQVFPKRTEWDGLVFERIPDTNINTKYMIEFGNIETSGELLDVDVQYTLPVIVRIATDGRNKPREAYYDLYDKCVDLSLFVADLSERGQNDIKAVFPNTITQAFDEARENIVEINLGFTFIYGFKAY